MAASAASAGSSPGLCPSYAVICSFLERYGVLLDLPELTFPQLERYLQDTSSVPKLLVDLHVKLLRKIGKSVSADRWEKYLVKMCHEFNSTWGWELENKGYKDMSVESKTGILKHLCECQFDDNIKFKTTINEEDPEQMRLQPIGKDKDGLMYWFQLDQDNNVRVYVEEQDDLDGSSWKCIVRDRNSLAEILALLKTQIDPALLTKKGEEEEGKTEVKKTEDTSEDEEDKPSKDQVLLDSPKTEITETNLQQEELKLDVSGAKFPLNGLRDNQAESTSHSEMPKVDEKVTIDTQSIKEETVEVSEPQCVMPPTEKTEEAKKKTAEELQRAMKNDQQAKIPLKKREMKLSEDFDNNSGSSIVMRTVSVTPVKEAPKVEKIKVVPVALEGQMKEITIDQVNGDPQPATEKSVNGLRESANKPGTQRETAYGKEQQTTAVVGGKYKEAEAIAKEKTNFTLDKDNEKQEMATNPEKPREVDESNLIKMVPSTMAEKKIDEFHEEGKQSALKKARPRSPSTTMPLTSSKATISPQETSNCKQEQHVKVSKWDMKVRCTEHKTSTLIQMPKNASANKTPKVEERTDSSILSQPVGSKEPEQIFVDICHSSVVNELKETTEATECGKCLNPKKLDTSVITKQFGRPDLITEKQDNSKCTEIPAIVQNKENLSSNKKCAKKCDGSKDIETSSVIKQTDISENSKYTVNLAISKDTNTTSVIKMADKPVPSKGDKLDNIKQAVKSSVIKMTVKSEVSKLTDMRCDKPKDIEMTAVTTGKTAASDPSTDTKAAKSTSGLKEVTMEDTSAKAPQPQRDDPKHVGKSATFEDAEKLVPSKEAENTAVPKDTEKPAAPNVNEKLAAPKDTEKPAAPKDTEKPAAPKDTEKPAAPKDSEKLATPKDSKKPAAPKDAKETAAPKDAEETAARKDTEEPAAPKDAEEPAAPKDAEEQAAPKNTGKPAVYKVSEKSAAYEDAERPTASKDSEKLAAPKDLEQPARPKNSGKSAKLATPKDMAKLSNPKDCRRLANLAILKDTEKSSLIKDIETFSESSTPKDIDILATPKELNKSDNNTETASKNVKKAAQKPDSLKKKDKLADTKPCAAKGEKLVTFQDDEHLLSLKVPVPQEEPVDIHSKRPTGDNVKITEYTDNGLLKMSLKSGENEIKPTKAQSENQATSKTDSRNKEDVTQKGDARSDDEAKREKVDDQTKKDDKKEKEMAVKDDKTMEEEVEKDNKVCEESEKEKPKNKKDDDKSEKLDAVTTSEIQEEGIRLKIRGITHRRKAELQREERDSGSDTGEMGRSLRRSPRICRPTPKGVEFQDRRLEKKQNTPTVEKVDEEKKEEEDEEEKEEETTVQRKPREKVDNDGQSKSKGRRRRKTRWSNSRMRRRKKNGSGEDDESESSEEESEEDDSDESFKVEGGKRKRRNRNRERHTDDSDTSSDDDLPPNDDPCKHCGLPNQPELILLCDSCDNGYHTACLRPPLMIIPDGEWFCPPCQHKLLCDKLEEQLTNLDAALKKRERAERRKERLVYVGISVENIITPSLEVEDEKEAEVVKKEKKEKEKTKSWGRRSTRAKKSISYRFDEFDEAIEEAIEEDIREADGGGAGRGKDMSNITGHSRGKDMATILAAGEAAEGKENGLPSRPNAGQRRKKRRRLNDLDSDSTMDDEESEDEFRLSDSTEEEEFVASEKSDVESEAAGDSNDDSDFGSARRRTARTRRTAKRLKSTRKRRKPQGYSDDEEEETSEEDEDDIVSEGSSEFSDSDLDCSRRRSRRSQTKKQVNYCESSGDSEGSKAATNRDKVKLRRRLDSSDSEASLSRGSDGGERLKRRDDSSEEESRQRRRRLSLKRRRASEEDDDDYDSDESSEGERPVRKRVNRIASDDSDEDEKKDTKEDEEVAVLGKGAGLLDYSLVELQPPTNGQSPIKALESLAHIGPQKPGATPVAIAPNGLEVASQDDDEDDLLGVTDLVDFVCNSDVL